MMVCVILLQDPEMDCAALGFCTQTSESKLILPKMRLQQSPLFKATKVRVVTRSHDLRHVIIDFLQGESDDHCEECKLAVTYAKTMLTDPDVQVGLS